MQGGSLLTALLQITTDGIKRQAMAVYLNKCGNHLLTVMYISHVPQKENKPKISAIGRYVPKQNSPTKPAILITIEKELANHTYEQ